MKRIIKILFSALILLEGSLLFAEDTLVFYSDDNFPPYSYADPAGHPCGLDIDIFNELCRRTGIKAEVKIVPFKRILRGLETGSSDGALGIFYTRERGEFSIFFDVPLHISRYVIFTKKDRVFNYRGVNDLYGKKVGKNLGFFISDEFNTAVKEGRIAVSEIEKPDSLIKMLDAGRIDCFIGNYASILHLLRMMNISDIVHLPNSVFSSRDSCMAISRFSPRIPDKDAFLKMVNSELQKMKKDGTIMRITSKYE